jgi:uncharacterized protein (TIGR02611 family)
MVAGLIMLVTPGPGIASIVAGLALLSTEFDWARRLLNWFRRRFVAVRYDARRRAGQARRDTSLRRSEH